MKMRRAQKRGIVRAWRRDLYRRDRRGLSVSDAVRVLTERGWFD